MITYKVDHDNGNIWSISSGGLAIQIPQPTQLENLTWALNLIWLFCVELKLASFSDLRLNQK